MSEMHDSANNIAYLLAEAGSGSASGSGAKAALAIPASDSADMQVVSYAQLASALRRFSIIWRRSVLSVVTVWRCLCRMWR